MRVPLIKYIFPLLLALALLPVITAGCANDTSSANRLVKEGDAARGSAADRLRKSTAAIDGLVRSTSVGQALPADQTRTTSDTAVQDLNSALADLDDRDARLREAAQLNLSDRYHDYLNLLTESNGKLRDTVNAALEIPRLLGQEQYSLAGWDEIRTQEVVKQIYSMQQRVELFYSDSESLRNTAEKLRADNPEDFGE